MRIVVIGRSGDLGVASSGSRGRGGTLAEWLTTQPGPLPRRVHPPT